MRYWLLVVMFVLISTNLSAQQTTLPANWELYRSKIHKFEIRHPSEWEVEEVGRDFVLFYPATNKGRAIGVGFLFPAPWVMISPSLIGCVDMPSSGDFNPVQLVDGNGSDLQVMFVMFACRNSILLEFGYWGGDSNREETRRNLLSILESFRAD